jgi:hypothetical protein
MTGVWTVDEQEGVSTRKDAKAKEIVKITDISMRSYIYKSLCSEPIPP